MGIKHYAPYGATNAACGETVPLGTPWDVINGEWHRDARFTVRRVRTNCAECRAKAPDDPANPLTSEQIRGFLTDVDYDGTSDEPIAVSGHPGQIAIYDDHEFLPGYAHCSTCRIKYEEI